jgi:hypothetical protein
VTNEEIWEMLRRGGLSAQEVVSSGEGRPEAELVGRYHGMTDPAGADRLGALLAGKARTVEPNVVVVGEGANDLVLGFVVARELALPLVRVLSLEGLVGTSGALPPSARGVFIADRVHKRGFVTAVRNLLEREGGELAAVVSIVTANVADLPVVCLGLVTVEEGLQRHS